jgi:hypothetical protein
MCSWLHLGFSILRRPTSCIHAVVINGWKMLLHQAFFVGFEGGDFFWFWGD